MAQFALALQYHYSKAMLDELYQEIILDHHKHPRCHGCKDDAQASTEVFNPLCGDKVELAISAANGRISEIGFGGHGCSISQAAASMMCELCRGKNLEEVQELAQTYRALMKGELTVEQCDDLGDATALQGVSKFPNRIKCALIAWDALKQCIESLDAAAQ